jgi:threonine/homoserine/homoserine lactone efflux protein
MLALLKGALIGGALGLGLGPGFVLQLHACMKRGILSAILVIFGLWTSDLLFLGLCYLGFQPLHQFLQGWKIGGMACGAVMVAFGLVMAIKKGKDPFRDGNVPAPRVRGGGLGYFASGFLINSLNPSIYVFWLGVMGFAEIHFGRQSQDLKAFFIGLVGSGILIDLIKCFLLDGIKFKLPPRIFHVADRIVGAALAITGAVICGRAWLAMAR